MTPEPFFREWARNGPRVVLLHSLGLDGTIWRDVVRALPEFDIVAYDLPGHGKSRAKPPGDINSVADIMESALRRNAHDGSIVVGMSLGGSVAMALACRAPDVVGGLVLAGTTAWYGPKARRDWSARANEVRKLGFGARLDAQLPRWLSPDYLRLRPDVARLLTGVFQGNDVDNYASACDALGSMDFRSALGAVPSPTAILVGEEDAATPLSHAKEIESRIQGSDLSIIPGCRHLVGLEAPHAVAKAVRWVHSQRCR